jgi:Zn-dependent M28 family amino/carboxypeptidase
MDHVGVTANGRCTAAGADSICNGADDDGSGTIGVVELARAFAALTPRPRRSIAFVTVSGEERGLWGSEWYVAHPVQPLAQHVADLNLDMISRNWRDSTNRRDSIAVLGKEMSTLGEVANRVTQQHPELGMKLVDDPEHNRYFMQSDHYSFATHGVPVLFFFSQTHPDLHRPTDDVSRTDADKAARVLKMVFYVALEVANATERPVWDATARQRIVSHQP